MKNLSYIVRKTKKQILPLALSSMIFFGGCERNKDKPIKGLFKTKNPGETEYIEYEKRIIFDERDFEIDEWTKLYDITYYDIESGKKSYQNKECEEYLNTVGKKEHNPWYSWMLNEDKVVFEKGYDFRLSPYGSGMTGFLSDGDAIDTLYFGKEYIQYNEKGELRVEPILNKMLMYTQKDLIDTADRIMKEKEPYLMLVATKEKNIYLLKQNYYMKEPLKIEIDEYKLKKSKVPTPPKNILRN